MNSIPLAIAWEIYARRRPALLAAVCSLPVFILLSRCVYPRLSEDGRSFLIGFPFAVALVTIGACFNFAQEEGFPRRLYIRPVRTWLLVACPMGYGAAAVVLFYVLWMTLVAHWALSGVAAATLATAMLSFQAIVWLLAKHRLLRIAALCALAVELVIVVCLPAAYARLTERPVELIAEVCLIAQSALVVIASIVHVARDRTGAGPLISLSRRAKVTALPVVQRAWTPFRSSARALDWFEWRRGGLLLPVGVGAGALAILFMCYIAGRGAYTEETTTTALIWLTTLPILLGGLVGVAYGRPDAWSLDGRVPSIYSLRPITCGEIVSAKIRVAGWSTLFAYAVLVVIAAAWMAWGGAHRGALRQLWMVLGMVWGPGRLIPLLVVTLVAAVFVTWGLMTSSLWAGLTRRATPVAVTLVGGSLLLAGVVAGVALVGDEPTRAQRLAVASLVYLPWVLATLVAIKMVITTQYFKVAVGRSLISRRFMAVRIVTWVLGVAIVTTAAFLFSPAVAWTRDLIILAGLLTFPLARIAIAPLTLAANRHR